MLKKISAVCFIIAIISCLAGCSKETFKIENQDWQLTLIQSNEDGSVIGCAPKHYEMHKEIENIIVVNLSCSAVDGQLTVADDTNHVTYTGTYSLSESEPECTIYKITMDKKTGTAVASFTAYTDQDGNKSKTPTLVMTIGDYSLTFQVNT